MTTLPDARISPEDEPHYHDRSFADIVERLFREFEDRLSLTAIVEVVRESRLHLRGSPIGALPELTERLAHERLERLVSLVIGDEPVPAATQLTALS
ncbi:three-helix bundle dimerization domain-containing protein [Jatrophihabitans sp.]|uniref:three-helix bundle dimerization domain-containing protein n=1 Tax=Jatrophihabitans sp. TaxID=1932789 RepID=UPI002C10E90C|nr:hypothetical protein [Jatrophihabitans sp.]